MNSNAPTMIRTTALALALTMALTAATARSALAQGTIFTYQGRLMDAGAPATGAYDMTFRLFDADAAGTQYGGDYPVVGVAVAEGLFTVALDFGAVFDGTPLWLEIEVNAIVLTPRQAISAAPYAQTCNASTYATSSTVADYSYAPWVPSGSDLYYVDGSVGIGTNAPDGKLHVAGGPVWTTNQWAKAVAIGNTGAIEFGHGAATTRYGIGASQDNLYFFRTSTEGQGGAANYFMFADSSGKVGVNTLSPAAKLHVRNTGLFSGGDAIIGETTDDRGVVGTASDLAGIAGQFTNSAGGVALKADGSLVVELIGDGAELLRLNSDRPWAFKQAYSGPGTALRLQPDTGLKNFEVAAAGGTIVATFEGNDAAPRLVVNGTTVTKVLQITGADLAEKFPISGKNVEPGTVMEIDPENPGLLRSARGAYNQRVAGVVSGANDFPAGAILGHMPGAEDAPPIALSGRVWTSCDASTAAIAPGDLLTTSATQGHAMKAVDRDRSHGAVIGKAMTSLARGKRGFVLVLVNLQ